MKPNAELTGAALFAASGLSVWLGKSFAPPALHVCEEQAPKSASH